MFQVWDYSRRDILKNVENNFEKQSFSFIYAANLNFFPVHLCPLVAHLWRIPFAMIGCLLSRD